MANNVLFDNLLNSLRAKEYFCPTEHVDRVYDIVKNDIPEDCQSNA